jgi:hypothetical protein
MQAFSNRRVYDVTPLFLTPRQLTHYTMNGRPTRFTFDTDTPPPVGSLVFLHLYEHWYEDVLRIPRNALFTDVEIGDYVYRIEDGTIVPTPVTVGVATKSYASILWGLEEGDVVHVGS